MNRDRDTKMNLGGVRREYERDYLHKKDLPQSPYVLFSKWFERAEETEKDPTAFVLSTSLNDQPNSRVVLLKGLENEQFVFYTNYHSAKGEELAANPMVALNFYWADSERQVRVRGKVSPVSSEASDAYFATRPKDSQIGAMVSQQSQEMASRDDFEKEIDRMTQEFADKTVDRPDNWGGYAVEANEMEFWQGRLNRLHDRFLYKRENGLWKITRLNP